MSESKPVLKLAFAMGGGVSLGAFSGAALTETIKLALLRIVEGTADYGDVEVDVFSGASAGSMSLAVMLRGLAWRTADEEREADEMLAKDGRLSDVWSRIRGTPIGRQFLAVQVAQNLQYKAWVEMIDLKPLLAHGDAERCQVLRYSPGLLDSEAVYAIARKLLLPKPGSEVNLNDRQLLGSPTHSDHPEQKRCLFACTLTSLAPFIADATGTFNTSAESAPGLRDAFRSQNHKDMRVFDISFFKLDNAKVERNLNRESNLRESYSMIADLVKQQACPDKNAQLRNAMASAEVNASGPEYFGRWFRLHAAPHVDRIAGDLRAFKSWARISASAIASGAFPGAFAPAVIERYKFEYGDDEWPKMLEKAVGTTVHAEQHPFAYVDGGVFNNDPIREAFRMASFMDARDESRTVIRRLVYVDPAVSADHGPLTVGALREQGEDSPEIWNLFSPKGTSQRSTLGRGLTLLAEVVGALVHQGRSREADGQAKTRNNFELRDRFRCTAHRITSAINDEGLKHQLREDLTIGSAYCLHRLYLERIPPGDGSIVGELRRVIRELKRDGMLSLDPVQASRYLVDGFVVPEINKDYREWLYAHLCLYFDLLLGLEGKNPDIKIVAITPRTYAKRGGGTEELKLLGDPFSAFAGFMSLEARQYDFKAGKHCAAVFLRLDKNAINNKTKTSHSYPILPESSEWDEPSPMQERPAKDLYAKQLNEGLHQLKDRLLQMVKDGLGTIARLGLPIVEVLNNVNKLIKDQVDDVVRERYGDNKGPTKRRATVEIMLLLDRELVKDGSTLELDAPGPLDHDAKPKKMKREGWEQDTPQVIFTAAHCEFDLLDTSKGEWQGAAVRASGTLILERPGFHLRSWGRVALPSAQRLRKLLAIGETHLRPVLKLVIRDTAKHPRSLLADTATCDPLWEACEMGIPLMERLMNSEL